MEGDNSESVFRVGSEACSQGGKLVKHRNDFLSREDYEEGLGLSSTQQAYWEESTRKVAKEVKEGRLRRQCWSLGLLSVVNRSPSSPGDPFTKHKPFVRGDQVEFVVMVDKSPRYGAASKVRTLSMIERGYLDEGGLPCIGGSAANNQVAVDFSQGPLHRAQPGLECKGVTGPLLAPRDGTMCIMRTGDTIDICVGYIAAGEVLPTQPKEAIAFRLSQALFDGDRPSATFADRTVVLPASGEFSGYREVKCGDPIIKLHNPSDYWVAVLDKGLACTRNPSRPILLASRHDWFKSFQALNELQNDYAEERWEESLDETVSYASVCPSTWAFGAMYPFSANTLHDGVLVDTRNITGLPGFEMTQALRADFIRGISPGGLFFLTSKFEGIFRRVSGVYGQPHLLQIDLECGRRQVIPGCAVLRKEIKGEDGERNSRELQPGDELRAGEVIGDICPRLKYHDQVLLDTVLDGNLFWQLEEFLQWAAIRPGSRGWKGPGILLDSRYTYPVFQYASRDSSGNPIWYWDFRNMFRWYRPNSRILSLPPVMHENWSLTAVNVGGVQVYLDEPSRPSGHKQGYRGKKRKPTTTSVK
jgi:hypothetical protein